MPPEEEGIWGVAGRQDNVVSRAQLFALGVGRRVIARQLESGRWRCLHRGIYLIGPAPPALPARARAAALACGEGAVVSHRTAAELWALLSPEAESDVHVTVLGRNPGTRSGIHTHRVRQFPAEDVTARHPIPLTTPARTICDLAAAEPLRDVESALAEAPRPPPRHRSPDQRSHRARPDPPGRLHHPQPPRRRGRQRLHPLARGANPARSDPRRRPRSSALQ
ncbi:MAG: type IV toxin-antitoxin system AbiEi family antitoxin domain-containing protein [Solirubrobacteraceae bacterium]